MEPSHCLGLHGFPAFHLPVVLLFDDHSSGFRTSPGAGEFRHPRQNWAEKVKTHVNPERETTGRLANVL